MRFTTMFALFAVLVMVAGLTPTAVHAEPIGDGFRALGASDYCFNQAVAARGAGNIGAARWWIGQTFGHLNAAGYHLSMAVRALGWKPACLQLRDQLGWRKDRATKFGGEIR